MERYAEGNGKTSETVAGNETHTAGDFLPEKTTFRDERIFQRKRAKISGEQNRAGREIRKTYAREYVADCKAGRICRCSVVCKSV